MSVHHLARDIWVFQIAPYLHKNDFLSLRLVNKEFCTIFTSEDIWTKLVTEEWYQYEEDDDQMNDNNGKSDMVPNHFEYFSQRWLVDRLFWESVEKNDVKCILSMLEMHGSKLIPCLLRQKRKNIDRLSCLSLTYRAHELTVFLKYSRIYQMLIDVFQNEVSYKNEEILLNLNRLDPQYYLFNKQRNQIRKRVISIYQSLIFSREHIDLIKFGRTTASVILIIKVFRKLVYNNGCDFKLQNHEMKLNEEYLIFPVYSGSKNSGLGYLSVICSICQDVGLDVEITKEFLLKIKDSNYKGGYSYLFLQRNSGKAEIFTIDKMKHIFRHVKRNFGETMNNIELMKTFFNMAFEGNSTDKLKDINFIYLIYTRLLFGDDFGISREIRTLISSTYELHILKLDSIFDFGKEEIVSELISSNRITSDLVLKQDFYRDDHFLSDESLPMEPPIKLKFSIGDIVFSERSGETYIVLGYKQKKNFSSEYSIYYFLMRLDGQFEVVHEGWVVLIDNKNYYKTLEKFAKHYQLGIFFERYDRDSGKLVWTKELEKQYVI